ncbi:gamma-glutamylcyclotransferase [Rhizobium lusitanum]|uniref:Gamma-glutamylcyclotransferase n=1 Tax=Rhizobium lusitanum TaxID=293958 RepID=A0A6L9UC36_9HYPH|nr:gamma-glutamylcyclotransferase family protein [Rhizobium lusitanum]NEI73164.1 gamma-glutamylcyclotransferase [Rhizobium lusitanum]
MSDTVFLFSYGTLQYPEVQKASFGRLLQGVDDAMIGFRKEMVEITDRDVLAKSGERFHPIVMPSEDSEDEVSGKLFQITADELAAADEYEVADYTRIEVTLKSGTKAWVYLKPDEPTEAR